MGFKIGIDVGNSDTKTQHTSTPSSFKKYATQNILDEESIFYDGAYYTPTNDRNNQQLDKTENDYCVLMSLFAFAKEIIFQIREKNKDISPLEIQNEISNITEVELGIGLPAGHFSALAKKTKALYMEKMGEGIQFSYRHLNNTFEFNFKLVKCNAYAQDYTAVAFDKSLEIPATYGKYYIIGAGGGTVDIIPVEKGKPCSDKCESIDMGSTVMYSEIIKTIQHETGKTMEYETVEAVLRDEPTIIDEARKTRIKELAKEFGNQLIDECIHKGLKLNDYPCVFIGGFALLLKDVFAHNNNIVKSEFVEDIRANAVYYAAFL